MQAAQVVSWFRLALFTLVAFMPAFTFAQLTKAGVVTTLHGTATVSRASVSEPVPLKFKDDVFVRDRISTGDDSVARILLGGKAIVTVRERSSLTISEVPGVATVNVGIGRAAIAVVRERMKPGETIEIRTPNAVAGIRGTIVVVEVDQTTAQASPNPAAFTTRFTVIHGEVLVRQLQGGQPFGGGVTLGANQQARFTGLTPPVTRSMTPSEAGQLSNSFKATKTDPPAAVNAPLISQSQAVATQLATTGLAKSDSSAVSSSASSAIQSGTIKGGSDKREDQAVQQATQLTPQGGGQAFTTASTTNQANQLLNSLPDSVKAALTSALGALGNSGSGSGGGSGSGPGSTTVTLPNGQTLQVILKDGRLRVDSSGKGGRGKD